MFRSYGYKGATAAWSERVVKRATEKAGAQERRLAVLEEGERNNLNAAKTRLSNLLPGTTVVVPLHNAIMTGKEQNVSKIVK